MRLAALTCALTLGLSQMAAADQCDTLWTAFKGAPLGSKLERDAGWSEAEFRYRAAQGVFDKAAEVAEGKTPEALKAEGKLPMEYALKLTLADKVLTCYAPEAGAVATEYETAMPATRRAEIIAPFRPKE
ncbi:hypothetical protein ACFO5X_08720 [Seohaeicola nanhaiensis]|uniref:Uncharacterized protein n=1 Tax=Seohaeicola nanhaiensis TaxID=1387282 RepID=A0ABV9KFE1_9RHOB